MESYTDLEYVADLTVKQKVNAYLLSWSTLILKNRTDDNWAKYEGDITRINPPTVFAFYARKGATYDIYEETLHEPDQLRIYDNTGRVIAQNDESNDTPITYAVNGVTWQRDILYDWVAPYTGWFYIETVLTAKGETPPSTSYFSRFYSMYVFEDIYTIRSVSLAGTQGNDDLVGSEGKDTLSGLGGSDILRGGFGSDTIDGGAGIDTSVCEFLSSQASIVKTASGYKITDFSFFGSDDVDLLTNIERLQFQDKAIALDTDGNAGQAYRLYQAAFDRKPDLPGLGYWIAQRDNGLSLYDAAWNFINSAEFKTLYGANVSNSTFISAIYGNVLHRAPDQKGFDYWLDMLSSNKASRHGMLAEFSESPENVAQVVGSIQNGIEYTPFLA
jgi:serralysin